MVFKKKFKKNKREVYKMARKRKGFKKAYRKAASASLSPLNVVLAGVVYGAARPVIANKLPTLFNFGGIDSDNVILAGAGYMATRSNNKFLKTLGLVAMGTEAGVVGSQMLSKVTGNGDQWDLSKIE